MKSCVIPVLGVRQINTLRKQRKILLFTSVPGIDETEYFRKMYAMYYFCTKKPLETQTKW